MEPAGCGHQPRKASRKERSTGRWTVVTNFGLAIAIHVVAVVLWIGGVALVTTVLLPAVRRLEPGPRQFALFEAVERRFARQARWTSLVAGISGFWMVYRLDLWRAFPTVAFWWLDAMVLVWLVFTVLLFVAEPLFLHRRLTERARRAPESTFALVERFHWLLLVLSLVTIFGAVAGAHGLAFFG
jgi:uncharacterized membrane protein